MGNKTRNVMEKQGEKMSEYHDRIHGIVDEMMSDCYISVSDIVGVLEIEKNFLLRKVFDQAKMDSMMEMLGGLLDGEEE